MSAQGFTAANYTDGDGNPEGGFVSGRGLSIHWQSGPLAVNGQRGEPNGAFVEDVIEAAKQRLEHYQESKFACIENGEAIHHLQLALQSLEIRTANRTARGVEGSHEL